MIANAFGYPDCQTTLHRPEPIGQGFACVCNHIDFSPPRHREIKVACVDFSDLRSVAVRLPCSVTIRAQKSPHPARVRPFKSP
jgi:hypothetical protein